MYIALNFHARKTWVGLASNDKSWGYLLAADVFQLRNKRLGSVNSCDLLPAAASATKIHFPIHHALEASEKFSETMLLIPESLQPTPTLPPSLLGKDSQRRGPGSWWGSGWSRWPELQGVSGRQASCLTDHLSWKWFSEGHPCFIVWLIYTLLNCSSRFNSVVIFNFLIYLADFMLNFSQNAFFVFFVFLIWWWQLM